MGDSPTYIGYPFDHHISSSHSTSQTGQYSGEESVLHKGVGKKSVKKLNHGSHLPKPAPGPLLFPLFLLNNLSLVKADYNPHSCRSERIELSYTSLIISLSIWP